MICPACAGLRHRIRGRSCPTCGLGKVGPHTVLDQIKEALKAAGWSVHSSTDQPPWARGEAPPRLPPPQQERTETMTENTTPKTYPAEIVAELALQLLDAAKVQEENRLLKEKLLELGDELALTRLDRNNFALSLTKASAELVLKSEKIRRLLTMAVTPVSVLKLGPGPFRALRRLKCETVADVTKLNKSFTKDNKGYRLIFNALAEYLEGR